MAQQATELSPKHRAFIEAQHIFFTASAAGDSRVNCSPKPASALRVLSPHAVAYLDLTGSGNETAAHARAGGHATFMFCAFDGPPQIMRLYGRARVAPRGTAEYATLLREEFGNSETPGSRQIIVLDIVTVQTSCGFGVPTYAYTGDRSTLIDVHVARTPEYREIYWREKNAYSIDGLPTDFARNASDCMA